LDEQIVAPERPPHRSPEKPGVYQRPDFR
jgi:hypothetical protein